MVACVDDEPALIRLACVDPACLCWSVSTDPSEPIVRITPAFVFCSIGLSSRGPCGRYAASRSAERDHGPLRCGDPINATARVRAGGPPPAAPSVGRRRRRRHSAPRCGRWRRYHRRRATATSRSVLSGAGRAAWGEWAARPSGTQPPVAPLHPPRVGHPPHSGRSPWHCAAAVPVRHALPRRAPAAVLRMPAGADAAAAVAAAAATTTAAVSLVSGVALVDDAAAARVACSATVCVLDDCGGSVFGPLRRCARRR